jgi:hypothetical protein
MPKSNPIDGLLDYPQHEDEHNEHGRRTVRNVGTYLCEVIAA